MNKRNRFLFALLFFFSMSVSGQEVLSNLNTSWTNVLPGVVISEPAVTSYGFCVVTDARILSAFSNSGTLLWEVPVSKSKNVIVTALPGDFICLIDNTASSIRLLNPSGGEIWSKKIGHLINGAPFVGRDGRLIFKGEKYLECYGMNGVCKWKIETEKQKNLPLQELPDGSVILFLNEEKGKTRGLRISPYGSILEEILFSGEIKKAYTCSQGVILAFSDGSSGLFSVKDTVSQNMWVLPKKNQNSVYVVSDAKNSVLFLEFTSSSITLNEVNVQNGNIVHSVKLDGFDGRNLKNISYDSQFLFLCNKKDAVLYNKDGNQLWSAKVPSLKSKDLWNYVIYTKSNNLVFCYNDWTVNSYRVLQNNSKSEKITRTFISDYSTFLDISNNQFSVLYTHEFENKLTDPKIAESLKKGFYGDDEIEWTSQIISICQMYSIELSTSDFGTRKEKSIFEMDSTGFEQILTQLMLLGTYDSQNCAASILTKTQNKSYLKIIMNGLKENGYDPDGNLLKALEIKAEKFDTKDRVSINALCDAVYSICLYMGRPAYNSKGKDILKKFLYPSYDSKIRDYSRDTLKKIIALDL